MLQQIVRPHTVPGGSLRNSSINIAPRTGGAVMRGQAPVRLPNLTIATTRARQPAWSTISPTAQLPFLMLMAANMPSQKPTITLAAQVPLAEVVKKVSLTLLVFCVFSLATYGLTGFAIVHPLFGVLLAAAALIFFLIGLLMAKEDRLRDG